MKILILDDDRIFLQNTRDYLEAEFEDEIIIDTYSSFSQISSDVMPSYDFIIIDYNLEGDDRKGNEFLEDFKKSGFKGKSVLATGEGDFILKTKIKAFSDASYLEKGSSYFYNGLIDLIKANLEAKK